MCGNCSVCCNSEHAEENSPKTRREELLIDKTIEAQKILSCIYRVKQNFGTGMVVAILRESKSEKVLAKDFHRLSTYGIMKEYSEKEIRQMISELLYQNFLMRGEYHTLKITPLGMQLLKSDVRFSMIDKSEKKKQK